MMQWLREKKPPNKSKEITYSEVKEQSDKEEFDKALMKSDIYNKLTKDVASLKLENNMLRQELEQLRMEYQNISQKQSDESYKTDGRSMPTVYQRNNSRSMPTVHQRSSMADKSSVDGPAF